MFLVSDPECLPSHSVPPFSNYYFLVHYLVNQDDSLKPLKSMAIHTYVFVYTLRYLGIMLNSMYRNSFQFKKRRSFNFRKELRFGKFSRSPEPMKNMV
jgi:hypothetical protein